MTEARLPTPRRIAMTPVVQQPSAFRALGDALSVAGAAGAAFEARRQDTDERIKEIDHRIAMDEQKRQDDALFIEKAVEWAQLEEQTRLRAGELRDEGSHRDHAARVRQEIDQRYRAFDESLVGNERVRQRFRVSIVDSAARIDAQEEEWARKRGFEAQGDALEAFVTTRGNQLSRANPEQAGQLYEAYAAEADNLIDAGAFSDDDAAVMKRAVRSKLAPKMNEALFNAGKPDAVQQLIEGGFYDGLDLDTSDITAQVGAERKALDLAEEQRQKEAQATARATADALEAKIKLGINPTQEEFDAANAALAAAGVPEAERISFGGLSVQMGLNRQFSEAADPEGIAAARTATALQAKIAAGTASEVEQLSYRHLADVADARAKAAGARRKDLASSGVQGQMAVLADLDRMAPEQRFTAANAAMDGLGQVAGLSPYWRQFALSGREVRKARAADFGEKPEVKAQFDAVVGPIAGSLGPSYDGLMTLAWDTYAGMMVNDGRAGWDKPNFTAAVQVAFGRTRRGDGSYQGGLATVSGKQVILPSFLTADEFERQLRSLNFAGAVYRDGRAAVKADVLDNYRPEYFADDEQGRPLYRMVDESGRPLGKKGGEAYRFLAVPMTRGNR